jgi:chromate reductase, NAD(P)H dehydrogenase (quinone)
MTILAFGASSSKKSINKQLVTYATSLLINSQSEILDLNNYELPLFSEDKEKELGQPSLAKEFLEKIKNSDGIIISFAEHNGSYSAAYKNLFDWCSRINSKVFQGKKLVLLSTSPGQGGGANVLELAIKSAPFFSGKVVGNLSVPNFYDNFDQELNVIKNEKIRSDLVKLINILDD